MSEEQQQQNNSLYSLHRLSLHGIPEKVAEMYCIINGFISKFRKNHVYREVHGSLCRKSVVKLNREKLNRASALTVRHSTVVTFIPTVRFYAQRKEDDDGNFSDNEDEDGGGD